ncbi:MULTISPECIES: hypothetical protein [unclassified Caballeronia]|uniref:hypothetical protein n=1 Tax=unclassified Caballeronia TaxID=2646786 RepID=UPI0020293439|nr:MULTISPECIES: hypothetical protein [unclassified Caballeronia]
MATNDFLPFAVGGSANVLSQSAYAALSAIANGYSSGVAQSAALNKTWRQSSIMAAVLAQFIADETGVNSVDDGTTATLLANLKNATPGRLLRVTSYTGGTFTWNKGAGTTAIRVRVQGPGGSGGGAPATGSGQVSIGSGGSSGSYGEGFFTTFPSSVTVTAPVGPSGTVGAVGTNGSTASFGALISAPGGLGGSKAGPSAPPFAPTGAGVPGPSTGGNIINTVGNGGGVALPISTGVIGPALGGSAVLGGGGVASTGGAGQPATGYGGGGGGTWIGPSVAAVAGGKGGDAIIIVEEFGSL